MPTEPLPKPKFKAKRHISFGDTPKTRSLWLLEVILDQLIEPKTSSLQPSNFRIEWIESSLARPQLQVLTTVEHLKNLADRRIYRQKYDVLLSEAQVRETLREYFDKFLGILAQERTSDQGRAAKNWDFVLTLWKKVEKSDPKPTQQQQKQQNLDELTTLWKSKVTEKKNVEQGIGQVKPQNQDQPSKSYLVQQSASPIVQEQPDIVQTNNPPTHGQVSYSIPSSGAANFVGRDTLLAELHQNLEHHWQVALIGMGGVGKTEMSIQYAYRYAQAYRGGVCWLYGRDAPNDATIAAQIISFATVKLGLNVPDTSSTIHERLQYCWTHWPPGKVLLVYDDIDKYSDIAPHYLPTDQRFRILLTTRVQLGPAVERFPVNVLHRNDSLALLAFLSKKDDACDTAEANALCQFLGDLPLGIELSGTYLATDPNLSIAELLEQLLRRKDNRTVLEHEAMGSDYHNDPAWTFTARRGLAAAFDLTWEKLGGSTQLLAKMIGRFEAGPIRWRTIDVMGQVLAEEYPDDVEYDPERMQRDRSHLIKYSLLKPFDDRTYRLHPLIREFFRGKTTDDEDAQYGHAI